MTPQGHVAAAPISWGVCEVPGWGVQLPPDRVLGEMRDLGITATEFGPDDYLPADPVRRAALLDAYGLRAVGGFLPLVLHRHERDPLPRARQVLDRFAAAGADTLVIAAASITTGYDERDTLDDADWATLLANVRRVVAAARERDIRAVLHPHVGTVVETRDELWRVLDAGVPLCLDTGHVVLGGADPVEVATEAADLVAHVHLKDVDEALAGSVRSGGRRFTDAVRDGVFRPLGAGGVDVAGVVRALAAAGYGGWYVLEQDRILRGDPGPREGAAPDVRASLEFLAAVLR